METIINIEDTFISDPNLLSIVEKQELKYRYRFMGDTVEGLAEVYRLTPSKLERWFKENDIKPEDLKTEEDIAKFELEVSNIFKVTQMRLMGLQALSTLKNWETLSITEEHLLRSLRVATENLTLEEDPHQDLLDSLTNTYLKLIKKHETIG